MNTACLARLSSVGGLLLLAAPAAGQVSFSIDYHSTHMGIPDGHSAGPITEGDLLAPLALGPLPAGAPLPTPGIWVSGGFGPPGPGLMLGLHPGCQGHPPGIPCGVEVDALSYGRDFNLDPAIPYMVGGNIWFSVDRFAAGFPTPYPPDVATEAKFTDAAADAFVEVGLFPGPLLPYMMVPANVGAIDGDGFAGGGPYRYPGLGLIEPSPPFAGDDLDALDVETPFFLPTIFFSLDAPWIDPQTGFPHGGSAMAHGFVAGDVLMCAFAGAPAIVYAPAPMLGLDLFGPDTDDLDALILWENGDNVWQPSLVPYDWATGATDMVLFSVRRGSAVIGMPDSLFGLPIEEGDILTTPPGPGLPPAMFIAAENLGLQTVRSHGVAFADDMDGADAAHGPTLDCDSNGIEDALDVALAYTTDANNDGVPDPCQLVVDPFCFGVICACGNVDPAGGCVNSSGAGAYLSASGTSVHALDDLVLTAVQLPVNQFGMFFMGAGTLPYPTVVGDGLICVGPGVLGMYRYGAQPSGPAGVITLGPGIIAYSCANFPPSGCIQPGFTWNFQTWFRDLGGPCGGGSNFSNAIAVTFVP